MPCKAGFGLHTPTRAPLRPVKDSSSSKAISLLQCGRNLVTRRDGSGRTVGRSVRNAPDGLRSRARHPLLQRFDCNALGAIPCLFAAMQVVAAQDDATRWRRRPLAPNTVLRPAKG